MAMTTDASGTAATNRPAEQREPVGDERDGSGAVAAFVAFQVELWGRTGAIVSQAVARTIASWWHSSAGGPITVLSHGGPVDHFLAEACERELRTAPERDHAELRALAAYGRFHAGYGYETVIFLDGDSFDEADEAANAHEGSYGEGLFEYLSQWEYGDGVERHATPPWGWRDDTYAFDGYIVAVNHGLAYASLTRIVTEPDAL